MFRNNHKWSRKRIHPSVTYIFLALSLTATGLLWRVLLTPQTEPEVSIVPGELPKKQEIQNTQAPPEDTTEQPASQDADVATPYPITLSPDKASEITVVVNKKHKLPGDYTPSVIAVRGTSLRNEAADALDDLFTDAVVDGHSPKSISGYRSYSTQASVYSGYVRQYGQAQADTFSARPGHSEHQTGLAVDVGNGDGSCDLEICFGATAFGEWLKVNAHLYGFIIRYPLGKESLTGYQYEPWHLRYVGAEVAEKVVRTQVTLDEYFGIPAGEY